MKCPTCGGRAEVIDSRETADWIRRRRKCANGHRYTSIEIVLANGECAEFIAKLKAAPPPTRLQMETKLKTCVDELRETTMKLALISGLQ